MTHEASAVNSLTHQVGELDSPEAAETLREKRTAERVDLGDELVIEQPYMIEGETVGMLSVIDTDGLTLAIWTNGKLFCTALGGKRRQVQTFVQEIPY